MFEFVTPLETKKYSSIVVVVWGSVLYPFSVGPYFFTLLAADYHLKLSFDAPLQK